ncbi:MAG: hypothetical protein AB3N33_06840 [Puniceicoccaceae bacterium]
MHSVLSFLLFDPSIVLMADDANYVMGAIDFLEKGQFPLAHGATLYHLVTAAAFALFGKSFLVGKACSVLWATLTLVLTYFVFRKLVSLWVLVGVLFIQASNFLIHFYASSNMSESFFMLMQMVLVATVFHCHEGLLTSLRWTRDSVGRFVLLCIPVVITSFLLSISKSVGIVAPVAVVLYLLLHRKWANGAVFLALFMLVKSAYGWGVKSLFGITHLSRRTDFILQKDYYRPEFGNEDVLGLLVRAWENFHHHVSVDLLRILGWRENSFLNEPLPAFSLLFLFLFGLCLWWSWRRKTRLLFVGLYLMLLAAATFVSLQTHWKQDRVILIMIPLALLFLLDGGQACVKERFSTKLPLVYGAVLLLGIVNLHHLGWAITRSQFIQAQYLKGNKLVAYTPDWQNYLKAAQWAGENLPPESAVLCRKGNTAAVYAPGHATFLNCSLYTTKPGDQVLKELHDQGVTHILLANLRLNPSQAVQGRVHDAVHSHVQAILATEPNALRIRYSTKNEERAMLLEINYAAVPMGF